MFYFFQGYPKHNFYAQTYPKIFKHKLGYPGLSKVQGYPGISQLIPTCTTGVVFQMNALGLSITQPLFSFTALEFQNSLSCFLHLRYEDSYLKFVSLGSVPWSPYVVIAAIHPNNQVYYTS